ncbi:pyrroloquinoline quinone-dependent dehydrogenase [Glacieibacterium megasporae]|uniref:pyrroloquinoline quinone-dependent dehydrogenase n=1 Tax=Glacieibacterium megasporae TaxID=2835787 RepID=UPI001C1DF993|nr:PQQ-binding-like beta-propeller repeat protein [Polymorphobacter megasporae]UAJ10568.1 PQQ-binding-like beta-propeller repeat protein [Polymorphobacter megasporae]
MSKKSFTYVAGAIATAGLIAAGALYIFWNDAVPVVGSALTAYETKSAAPGTMTTEVAARGGVTVVPRHTPDNASMADGSTAMDWPSYNKTPTSQRFSALDQITVANVSRLQVLCTYDTHQRTSFEVGPIVVEGALIATTEHDIFSLNPANCHLNWRTHEDYKPANLLAVNRGAAYLNGMLFRGTQDGRVLAYDFVTGKRLWQTTIADPKMAETTPAAPIAWHGLVFIGNAGGDSKGNKGRMYALDAKSGRIVWEFYLVPRSRGDRIRGPQGASPLDKATWRNTVGNPVTGGATWTSYTLDPESRRLYIPSGNSGPDFIKSVRDGANFYSESVVVLDALTGAFVKSIQVAPGDWHDWDVSSAPVLIQTRGGRRVLSVAPKDGRLYGFDLTTGAMIYRTPVTTVENAEAPFEVGKNIHFCPGTNGGAEWNSPAFDPTTNLVIVGETDWCFSVKMQSEKEISSVKIGAPYTGNTSLNPYDAYGKADPYGHWAGWLYGIDADTGAWRWRVKSNYPIMGGVAPTAGGLVFFGDMGGNFYAIDATNGRRLWGKDLGGAIGGGVITFATGGVQKVAVAAGFTSITWPTRSATGTIVILALDPAHVDRP